MAGLVGVGAGTRPIAHMAVGKTTLPTGRLGEERLLDGHEQRLLGEDRPAPRDNVVLRHPVRQLLDGCRPDPTGAVGRTAARGSAIRSAIAVLPPRETASSPNRPPNHPENAYPERVRVL